MPPSSPEASIRSTSTDSLLSSKQAQIHSDYFANGLNHGHPRSQTRHRHLLHILCFALHLILIVLHVVLFVVHFNGWEQRVRAETEGQVTSLSIGKTVISQTFAIGYLAVLLYLTQKLALRRILYEGNMVATHDKHIAWIGLGSAFQSLWNQLSVASSPTGVAAITLYLLLTAALKITTPALFELVPVNETTYVSIGYTSVTTPPLFTAELQDGTDLIVDDGDGQNPITRLANSAVSIAPFANNETGFPALGLYGNMLYDVIDENQGFGDVKVNARVVNVTCGATNITSPGKLGDTFSFRWRFEDSAGNNPVSQPPVVPNVMTYLGRSRFSASFEIIDSNGSFGPQLSAEPPINHVMNSKIRISSSNSSDPVDEPLSSQLVAQYNLTGLFQANVTTVTVYECGARLSDVSAFVNSQSRVPSGSTDRKTLSRWDTYNDAGHNDSSTDRGIRLDLLWSQAKTLNKSATLLCTDDGLSGYPNNIDPNMEFVPPKCEYQSPSEKYFMDLLGISAAADIVGFEYLGNRATGDSHSLARTTLHELENALENHTASMLWSMSHVNGTSSRDFTDVATLRVVSQLRLSIIPLSVGLGCSTMLLVLTPLIIGLKGKNSGGSVDTLGVLQILWLARRDVEFQGSSDIVSKIDNCSSKELRKGVAASYRGSAYAHDDPTLSRRKTAGMDLESP